MDPIAVDLDNLYGSPLTVIADCIRSFICAAPEHDLYACDFSNIEGRVLAWLAGEGWKLEAFREFDAGRGPDIYLVSAGRIYEVPASNYTKASPERQHGKVAELACGYQGGVGAFADMARTYLLTIDEELARTIVKAWREAHPMTKQFWRDLERAAVKAVQEPGGIYAAGAAANPIRFRMSGSFLWCQLPSKGVLCYPYPELQEVGFWRDKDTGEIQACAPYRVAGMKAAGYDAWTKPQLTFMGVDSRTKAWARQSTYGGSLAENVTQAVSRDLLADAMIRVERADYPVVLHVHDEIVSEVPRGFGNLKEYEAIMMASEPWADGLPVVAKGWHGKRYRKG